MLYTVSPSAGDDIALTCVVVILGNRTPFVVLVTSSKDEAFGASVPIPTLPEVNTVILVASPFALVPKNALPASATT